MRCVTTHLQVIATQDAFIDVDNRRVSVPKGISVLEVKPGWNVTLAAGVSAYDLPANAFFFSRSNNDKEFQLLKDKLELITSNIAGNQSVLSSQLSALAADVAEIKATGAKSAEISVIISRLDNLSGNGDSVTLSQFNELSGQVSETKTSLESLSGNMGTLAYNMVTLSQFNELSGQVSETKTSLESLLSNSGQSEEISFDKEISTNKTFVLSSGRKLPVFLRVVKADCNGPAANIKTISDFPDSYEIIYSHGKTRYYQQAANRYVVLDIACKPELISDGIGYNFFQYANSLAVYYQSNVDIVTEAVIYIYFVKERIY